MTCFSLFLRFLSFGDIVKIQLSPCRAAALFWGRDRLELRVLVLFECNCSTSSRGLSSPLARIEQWGSHSKAVCQSDMAALEEDAASLVPG